MTDKTMNRDEFESLVEGESYVYISDDIDYALELRDNHEDGTFLHSVGKSIVSNHDEIDYSVPAEVILKDKHDGSMILEYARKNGSKTSQWFHYSMTITGYNHFPNPSESCNDVEFKAWLKRYADINKFNYSLA